MFPRRADVRRLNWMPLVVALAAALPFLPSLRAEFLIWDDNYYIVNNHFFRGFGPLQLRWMFTTALLGVYQPVAWLSYALDFKIWGLNPAGFHLTNLVIHGANAALYWGLALRLLKEAHPDEDMGRLRLAAAFTAMFFAVHPLRTEDVAWVSERRELLCVFFYLAALRQYLAGRLAVCWGLFMLAVLSKALAVTFPCALLILDWYRGRTPRRSEKIWFFAPAVGAGLWTLWEQHNNNAMRSLTQHGLAARIAHAAYSLCFYPAKTLWPSNLSPIYELPARGDFGSPRFLFCSALMMILVVVIARARRRHPAWAACAAYYAVTLAPVSGLLHGGSQLVADRYSYLSCLAWPLLAGAGLLRTRRWGKACGCLIVLILSALSFRQTLHWRDSLSFWSYAVKVSPKSALAHNNLGSILPQNRLREAAAHFQEALSIDPDCAPAQDTLARLSGQSAAFDQAQRLARVINDHPICRNARFNLMTARAALGETREPEEYFRMLLRLEPDNAKARAHLDRIIYNTQDDRRPSH